MATSPGPSAQDPGEALHPPASRREILAWAMYDFANSGYTTVVLTAVYNAYFVTAIAGEHGTGAATLLWALAVGLSNGLVLLLGPAVGAIADQHAAKKRFLAAATVGCAAATVLLALAGPGQVALAMGLLILSNATFGLGEILVSAFLPELAPPERLGRVSGLGWSLGYVGGLLTLGLCLGYAAWVGARGEGPAQFVPGTLLIVAAVYLAAAWPTLRWVRERARPQTAPGPTGLARFWQPLREARHYEDLWRFLGALAVYSCGVSTVIVMAAVYAQAVMGLSARDTMALVLVLNVTAALGALAAGFAQDRLGSVRTLALTLGLWMAAIAGIWAAPSTGAFWLAANMLGFALGAGQTGGRAMVAQFSPPAKSAQVFGLWGTAVKLAAVVGPLAYGAAAWLSHGDLRRALAVPLGFFLVGLVLLLRVDERRGRSAAR
jgi:UMF1 family MFS transporter